jgi:toxin YoeB
MYKITFSPKAKKDIAKLRRSEPTAHRKVVQLLNELIEHPTTGTGKPEPLKGDPKNRWSRRITHKHRLIYRIFDTEIYIDVLSAYGHYEDK